jgi:hypothetical protein
MKTQVCYEFAKAFLFERTLWRALWCQFYTLVRLMSHDLAHYMGVSSKVTSPMTPTIRIPLYSKCGTILQTFFSDRTLSLEKNGCGIIIFRQNMN